MHFKKVYILFFMIIINYQSKIYASTPTDNAGFYVNLSMEEKMHLIISKLDEGLYQIFVNYHSNNNVPVLTALLSAGIEGNKAIFTALNIDMHPNVQYLTFLQYAFFLCKYGKTSQFLVTLTSQERIDLFNVCYQIWLTCYTNYLNENLTYMLDDITEYFESIS